MTDMPGGVEGGDLTGSPELFASNLLIVRAIEHDMEHVTIRLEDDHISVQNQHDERDYEKETLTEDLDHWPKIKERFESMTDFGDDKSEGVLEPTTPAADRVDRIDIAYPDDRTIELSFHHPDS